MWTGNFDLNRLQIHKYLDMRGLDLSICLCTHSGLGVNNTKRIVVAVYINLGTGVTNPLVTLYLFA